MGRKQDAAEFLKLLAPLKGPLARYAHRTAWNAQDAQDIVQDAVTVAWREFHRFRPGTNFRAWMFKITVFAVYRANKQHGRDRDKADVDNIELPDVSIEREEAWQSVLEEPERVMQSLDDRLLGALKTLGETERQCLLLRLLEGFTYREIADLIDMPVGTIMSHVHRARMKLRERLAELAIEKRLVEGTAL